MEVRIFKNGARVVRERPLKQKGGFVGEVLQGITDVVGNLVKNVNRPKTRSEMKKWMEENRNRPEMIAERQAEEAEMKKAGYQWQRLQSGRYQLFNPITGEPATNSQGEPVIMSANEYLRYNPTLNAMGQDSNIPITGQGLAQRRRRKTLF